MGTDKTIAGDKVGCTAMLVGALEAKGGAMSGNESEDVVGFAVLPVAIGDSTAEVVVVGGWCVP
jgi:hypothetical protein